MKHLNLHYLTKQFYQDHPKKHYSEIERKETRMYAMFTIKIDAIEFAIPFRSNINHPHAFFTDKANRCGIDYSKAVVITKDSYVDKVSTVTLRQNEFNVLKQNEHVVRKGFIKYLDKYKKSLNNQHIPRNKILCDYSTLQYFHTELGI